MVVKNRTSYKTPEQLAATQLLPLGFTHVTDMFLPYSFADKDGDFGAKPDFYHASLDLYVEIKCDHLNGKTTKAKAELAYSRIEPAKRAGRYATFYQTRNQWNHAARKQAIVQSTIGAPQFAIIFTKQPDEETLKRLVKHDIQAFCLSMFTSMIELQLAVGHH